MYSPVVASRPKFAAAGRLRHSGGMGKSGSGTAAAGPGTAAELTLNGGNNQSAAIGAAVIVDSIDDAIDYANAYAPEHLELQIANARESAARCTTSGAIFIGAYSSEAAGDYLAGGNTLGQAVIERCLGIPGGVGNEVVAGRHSRGQLAQPRPGEQFVAAERVAQCERFAGRRAGRRGDRGEEKRARRSRARCAPCDRAGRRDASRCA